MYWKRMLICTFCLFLIINNQLLGQEQWDKINFKAALKDTLFVSDHFIYSGFTYSDDNGKLHSSMADESGKEVIDTNLYLIGSDCIVDNGNEHQIRFCDCSYNSDTISVYIHDDNPAYTDNINIKGYNRSFSTIYKATYPVYFPGEKYVWKIKKQKLKVTTNQFQKGRWLNGFINLEIAEYFKSDTYPLSLSHIKIKGYFKCILE
jgi:hypothetical protein